MDKLLLASNKMFDGALMTMIEIMWLHIPVGEVPSARMLRGVP